jgi:pimeloyl-ACP methyl ester carboxylesterase
VRARLVGIWGGRDAFTAHHQAQIRAVLATADPGLETRTIGSAGHWVNYEAADEVNALLLGLRARRRPE